MIEVQLNQTVAKQNIKPVAGFIIKGGVKVIKKPERVETSKAINEVKQNKYCIYPQLGRIPNFQWFSWGKKIVRSSAGINKAKFEINNSYRNFQAITSR